MNYMFLSGHDFMEAYSLKCNTVLSHTSGDIFCV